VLRKSEVHHSGSADMLFMVVPFKLSMVETVQVAQAKSLLPGNSGQLDDHLGTFSGFHLLDNL
jgi:hypothetical protein